MRVYGLIGYPLSHSFSQTYFRQKFEREGIEGVDYFNFPLEEVGNLQSFIDLHAGLYGLNVTIPHKESIIPLLDQIDPVAQAVGAVNTIDLKTGERIGYNTDVIGFRESLQPLLRGQHTQALVLGTGGASKAVCYVLKELGISYQLVSRTKSENTITYDEVDGEVMHAHPLIINTTPLGTFPDVLDKPALPYHFLNPTFLLYDLVYNPPVTAFMQEGLKKDCTVKNGQEMLELQAEAAWEIWNA